MPADYFKSRPALPQVPGLALHMSLMPIVKVPVVAQVAKIEVINQSTSRPFATASPRRRSCAEDLAFIPA